MARQARGELLDPREIQVVHTIQRCVRRAFLCGSDSMTGRSFEHRRGWIRDRLELLTSVFAIDCLTYAVMDNHMHVVLRSRPDIVDRWSDREVARRWLKLFPSRRNRDRPGTEPTEEEIQSITSNANVVASFRKRLSDISWWMRCLAEVIARRANREDQCTGRFWEGRFKAQLLLDEESVLACSAYVDLNPVHAAMAETPEESKYTGAKERIEDLKQCPSSTDTHTWEREHQQKGAWLSPIETRATVDPVGPDASSAGKRSSKKGFLNCTLSDYLNLLNWTAMQLQRSVNQAAEPHQISPILNRLGISQLQWCHLIQRFGTIFKRVVGTAGRLKAEAKRRKQNWMQAPGNPLQALE